MLKPNLDIFLQYYLQAGDINFMNLLVYVYLNLDHLLDESKCTISEFSRVTNISPGLLESLNYIKLGLGLEKKSPCFRYHL